MSKGPHTPAIYYAIVNVASILFYSVNRNRNCEKWVKEGWTMQVEFKIVILKIKV